MKVYEILTESKSITGIINSVLKGVAWTLGRTPQKIAAAELAEVWSRKMIAAGTTNVPMPINVIKDPKLAVDREVIDAANAIAKDIFKKAENEGLITSIKTGAGATAAAVGQKAKTFFKYLNFMARWGSLAASIWGVGTAFSDYLKTEALLREKLQKVLEDPKVSDADKERALAECYQEIGSARLIYSAKVIAAITVMGKVTWARGAVGLSAKGVDLFKNWILKAAGMSGNRAATKFAAMMKNAGDPVIAYVVWQIVTNDSFHTLLDDIVWNSAILQGINVNIIQPEAPFGSWEKIEDLFKKGQELATMMGSGSSILGTEPAAAPAQSSAPAQAPAPTSNAVGSSGVDWSTVKR